MTLYIDGDALPNALKPVLLKAIIKRNIKTIVVSNKKISIGDSKNITYIIVEDGLDKADQKIVDLVNINDLVITADIPLADFIVQKGAFGIDHRGLVYDEENIKEKLTIRNLMQELRDSGEITGGPKPFSKNDVAKFAASFNEYIQKLL